MKSILPLIFACSVLVSQSLAAQQPAPGFVPEAKDSPAAAAFDAFQAEKFAAAIQAATPLAKQNDPDALFLLGTAARTGKGLGLSRDKALEYFNAAIKAGHKGARLAKAGVLLESDEPADKKQALQEMEAAVAAIPATAAPILGQLWLGKEFEGGPDPQKAIGYWEQAIAAGNKELRLPLANLHTAGGDFKAVYDLKRARDIFTAAAEDGETQALLPLGRLLLTPGAPVYDETKGIEWLEKAAAADLAEAWWWLGIHQKTTAKDAAKAYESFLKGANAGHPPSMHAAGEALATGTGTAQDPQAALKWITEAADKGVPRAHFELATTHLKGKDIDADAKLKALGHMTAAAMGGLLEAQVNLAIFYEQGNITGQRDLPAAASWFARAAQAGDPEAQFRLAAFYENGAAVSRDLPKASEYYTAAFAQGHGPATVALARFAVAGLPEGPPDLAKGYALARIAMERKAPQAAEMLGSLDMMINNQIDSEELRRQGNKQYQELSKPATPAAGAAAAPESAGEDPAAPAPQPAEASAETP